MSNDENFNCVDCEKILTHKKELIHYICFECQELEDANNEAMRLSNAN
jgi:predicted RNA-binding Zn-ribbon protein involved in translation (DUF1610 family)